jgi:AcrR family transcriptional regulator
MIEPTNKAAPRRRRPKDRRDQILRSAFALIAESGFNAVSLADIAKACGIQKSSVLHHFPSMNHILLEVLRMREDEDYAIYAEDESIPGESEIEAARRRFTRVFEFNLARPQLVRLYSILSAEALASDHPAHDFFAERNRTAIEEIARMLTWKPAPLVAAIELHAFWDGLDLAWRGNPDIDLREVWESFCDRFFV